jgi:hypothetical protein
MTENTWENKVAFDLRMKINHCDTESYKFVYMIVSLKVSNGKQSGFFFVLHTALHMQFVFIS